MTYSAVIPLQLGKSQTGLTLKARTYDPATGTDISGDITTGFVERVDGRYDFSYASYPDNTAIGVRFISGTTEVASTVLNITDVYDILAMKTKLDALNVSTAITVATPIDPVTGDLTIYRGDAYTSTSPKGPLVWTNTGGLWLPYAGKTSVFTGMSADRKTSFSAPAVITNTSGNTCTITVELDSNKTNTLTDKQLGEGDWVFDVQSTISTGEDDTPLSGNLSILIDVSPKSS